MKKIAGKIAMILIMVMLANTFISCFTALTVGGLIQSDNAALKLLGCLVLLPAILLDIITFPVQLAILAESSKSIYVVQNDAPLTDEELAILSEIPAYLPEADRTLLTAGIAAMPIEKRASALAEINSLPERQLPSMVKAMRALYALPQEDRVFLAEAKRSLLPEEERALFAKTARSLSDDDVAALADEISSIPVVEMKRQINILRETPVSDWGCREYVAERFVTR